MGQQKQFYKWRNCQTELAEENNMAGKKKTKAKSVTLAEFHAWLEGVEEMQTNGWTPTKEQWRTIREKINSITMEPTVVNSAAPAPRVQQVPRV